jgi:hypothetical protein
MPTLHSKRFNEAAARSHRRSATSSEVGGEHALIYEGELEMMARFVCDYPDIETGGDLFGFWTHSGSPVIEYVLGPGVGAQHEHAAFYQESPYLLAAGNRLHELHGLQHIGTWHSHHRLKLFQPSHGDSVTMQRALESHGFHSWLLTICTFAEDADTVEMHGYLYRAGGRETHQQITWLLLPGSSPIRAALEATSDVPFVAPRTETAAFEAVPGSSFAASATVGASGTPAFPSTSFMSTTEGRNEFHRFFERLSTIEQNVEILQREDGRVSLCLERDGYMFDVVFPHSYPVLNPVIEYQPIHVPPGQEDAWKTPRTLYTTVERTDDATLRIQELIECTESLIAGFLMNRETSASPGAPERKG